MFFTGPEKGASLGVQKLPDVPWQQNGGHVVNRQAAEH